MSGKKQILIDSHCHIQFPAYDGDRKKIIARAQDSGVKMIAVGTDLETSRKAIEVARQYPDDIWATVGFHPGNKLMEFDAALFKKMVGDKKVVAIGECGFEYFHPGADKGMQEKIFAGQIEIAKELEKPLMMHCRPSKGTDDAYEDAINILENQSVDSITKIMHFYGGSLEMAKKLLGKGFYFTFGGVITFARSYDEILRYLPLDRIFLETDSPYVSPEPYRGQRNEPVFVIEIAKKLAEIKDISFENLAEEILKNNRKIFKVI